MKKNLIFLDGKFIKADKALLDSLMPGIIQGKGVFETMRVFGGNILALELHLERFTKGLNFYKLNLPYSKKKICILLHETLRINKFKDARIRLAVWKENSRNRISIIAQKLSNKKPEAYKIIISSFQHPGRKRSYLKSLDYFIFREAYQEALEKGADEAILLNKNGEVVEGSRSNIFFIKDNILYTPTLVSGCLNGIMRGLVLKKAKELRVSTKETNISLQQLMNCDEAFLTNSVIGFVSIVELKKCNRKLNVK